MLNARFAWPGAASRVAVAIISGELSTPTTAARGQRCASAAVRLPGPHPRSATERGSAAPTWAIRSKNGRDRSPPNLRYCPASQMSPIGCPVLVVERINNEIKNLDIKTVIHHKASRRQEIG